MLLRDYPEGLRYKLGVSYELSRRSYCENDQFSVIRWIVEYGGLRTGSLIGF